MLEDEINILPKIKAGECNFCTMRIEDFEESETIDGKEYHKPCGKIMRAVSVQNMWENHSTHG